MMKRNKNKYFKKTSLYISIILIILIIITSIIVFFNTTIKIKLNYLNVRERPTPESKIVAKPLKGDKLLIIGEKYGWYEVKTDKDQYGWVPSWIARKDMLKNKSKNPSFRDEFTITIDAGHGGKDPGSSHEENSKNTNYQEKKYTLEYAKSVKEDINKNNNSRVILTRKDDTLVPLKEIVNISKKNNSQIFISIHFDSSKNKNEASGHTTYYYNENSYKLAEFLNSYINKKNPLQNRGVDEGNFYVIRYTKIPSILLELGYINSNKDFQIIKNPKYIKNNSINITNGLEKFIDTNFTSDSKN